MGMWMAMRRERAEDQYLLSQTGASGAFSLGCVTTFRTRRMASGRACRSLPQDRGERDGARKAAYRASHRMPQNFRLTWRVLPLGEGAMAARGNPAAPMTLEEV